MLRPYRRRRQDLLFFGIPFLLAVTAGVLTGFFRPLEYEGAAKIAFAEKQGDGTPSSAFGLSFFLSHPLGVLQSPETAIRVWKRIHPEGPEVSEKEIKAFQKKIRIYPPPGYDSKGAEVLIIRVRDKNPKKAAEAANLLPGVGAAWAVEVEGENQRLYLSFLEDRIRNHEEKIKKEEGEAKSGPEDLLPQSPLSGIPPTAKDLGWSILTLEVLKTQAALKEAQTVLSLLRRKVKEGSPPPKMLRENSFLGILGERFSRLEDRVDPYDDVFEGEETAQENIKNELERLRQELKKGMVLDLEGREMELSGLEARLKLLQKALNRWGDWSRKGDAPGRPWDDHSLKKEVYRYLLKERERLLFYQALGRYRWAPFIFLEKAVPPQRPVGPDRLTLLLFGVFLGLATGGTALVLRRIWDPALKSAEEVEQRLKVPVLGAVPWDRPSSKGS